ncbi:MAG: HD-GYP domain-containing protein [Simplicispira sp.]|nr:HD-GYP domain-containing protein [Simplicispira sp.]
MLKRISVQHLTLGMHIHEFCGSWMEHPFWRTQFTLSDPKDIASIRASAIREVWIDVSIGLDIAPGVASTSRQEVEERIDTDFSHLEDLPPLQVTAPMPLMPEPRSQAPTSMQKELKTASTICQRSKQAVVAMFQEARMGRAVDAASTQSLVQNISDSISRHPNALISLARLKVADDYSYMHSVAVCALMVALARQIGLNDAQVHTAGLAGLLHDLGKAAIPLSVLNKPGKLTDEEFAVVRNHPVQGHQMLQRAANLESAVLDACLHHHEKMDGSGYPDKLPGTQISLIAKMTAICDVYDAITSDRPYKSGWDPSESLRRMAEWTNDHFDRQLFHAFVKSIGIYPVGSLVRLSCGRVGVVIEQGQGLLTTPRVKVFFSTHQDSLIPPEVLNLAEPGCQEKIVAREDPEKWRAHDLTELWSGLKQPTW